MIEKCAKENNKNKKEMIRTIYMSKIHDYLNTRKLKYTVRTIHTSNKNKIKVSKDKQEVIEVSLLEIIEENKELAQKTSQMKALDTVLVSLQKKHKDIKNYKKILKRCERLETNQSKLKETKIKERRNRSRRRSHAVHCTC